MSLFKQLAEHRACIAAGSSDKEDEDEEEPDGQCVLVFFLLTSTSAYPFLLSRTLSPPDSPLVPHGRKRALPEDATLLTTGSEPELPEERLAARMQAKLAKKKRREEKKRAKKRRRNKRRRQTKCLRRARPAQRNPSTHPLQFLQWSEKTTRSSHEHLKAPSALCLLRSRASVSNKAPVNVQFMGQESVWARCDPLGQTWPAGPDLAQRADSGPRANFGPRASPGPKVVQPPSAPTPYGACRSK